jgi:tetratricopeptide (TPR) repeat protein
MEQFQKALDSLSQALPLKASYILALARRGIALQSLGQSEEGTLDFEAALLIEPQNHEDWRGRGIALNELKRHKEAITSYDKALEVKPECYLTWFHRGVTLVAIDQPEEAIASYDKALEVKPDYYNAWCNRVNALDRLGMALVKLGQY